MGQAINKRIVAALLAAAQIAFAIVAGEATTMLPALATTFACNAGNDGAGGTLSGQGANTYFKPANGTLSSGATTISIGTSTTADTTGGGSPNTGATQIGAGDLLLVIQMQDGSFTYSNDASYGTGASIGNAGLFEYVQVVSTTTTSATILGGGAGGGLINSYTEAAKTGTTGQKTYQIIRVPQYLTATLGSSFTAAYWDGGTGGVAAIDVASTLNLGGVSVYVTGDGFRGGAVSVAGTSPSSVLNNDYVDSASMNGTTAAPAQGFKGEGIFGTPSWAFYYTTFTTPSTPTGPTIVKAANNADGYPGGDMAMGAPGNAGGGGTDADPAANDQNTGGGGGGNGGAGGNGGYPWSPNFSPNPSPTLPPPTMLYAIDSPTGTHTAANFAVADSTHNPDIGGRGGAAIATGVRALMGGGGGSGSNNNGSEQGVAPNTVDGSSGGTGGGVLMMRIADTSGSASTLFAEGTTGLAPDNDGGGGGGAGGTIIVTSPNAFSGLTAYARGAAGTSAFWGASDSTKSSTPHGPGGGGGGGVIYSSSPITSTVTGGAHGVTVSGISMAYGSTSGDAGTSGTISYNSIPGAPSGAECYSSTNLNAPYIGPVDSAEATYNGANETGSYDGIVTTTNNNDFTAASMDLSNASTTPTNTGTVAGSFVGSNFTFSTAPTIKIPHMFYYDAASNATTTVTLTATAPQLPSPWKVQICPDTAGINVDTASTPNCATAALGACSTGNNNKWNSVTAASTSTNTATFCSKTSTARYWVFWTVYTPAAGTYTTFNRYDGTIVANDTTYINTTHDEVYAGFVPITKTAVTVSPNPNPTPTASPCPASVLAANQACPGSVVVYPIDYRNIMAGAGLGTEAQLLNAFLYTKPGTLVISDNGAATFTNGASTNNTTTYTVGLGSVMVAGGSYTACNLGASTCGASQASTTFTGNTIGSTSWTATVGGAAFELTPDGYTTGTNNNWQGTIKFAERVK